jgi:heme exporter protein A
MLVANQLALTRGGLLLFERLSFTLAAGGALLVTGPNGAGKSSLLRLVAGLLEPDAGTLENPCTVGFLGMEPALKPDRPLRAELAFWRRLDGAVGEGEQPPEGVAEDAMGLAPLLDLPVGYLSAGQRQRAAIARLMQSGTRLWLLDEPTTALDTAGQERLRAVIAAHRAAGGLVVAATHQPLPLPGAATIAL